MNLHRPISLSSQSTRDLRRYYKYVNWINLSYFIFDHLLILLLFFPPIFLQVLQMSWQQERIEIQAAMDADSANPAGDFVKYSGKIWKWWGTVIHSVILVSPTRPFEEGGLSM